MTDALLAAQEALGLALERARAGEDRALAQQVRELGEQLVRLLAGLLRLLRTHGAENHALDAPIRDFASATATLFEILGPLHLVCVEGQVYLNDIRVRVDERLGGTADLADDLARHGCGGVQLRAPLGGDEARRFVMILGARPTAGQPIAALHAAMQGAGLRDVGVQGPYRLRLAGGEARPRPQELRDAQATLGRAAARVAEAMDNLAAARVPNPLPVRRLVNDLIDTSGFADLLLSAEQTGPSLNAPAPARHALRVCTLSILIGRELGLSNAALADLGVAAMFHDTGFVSDGDGAAPPFERHGLAGARLLLKQRGFHHAKIKRLLVAFEHHLPNIGRPSLYARIVHVADDFDTLTRHRPGGALHGPAHALAMMDAASGTLYDPVLLQAFVNRVGRYPPGTLLRLRDGRWVVSTSGARSPAAFARPLCALVRDATGAAPTEPVTVDLMVEGEIARVVPLR